MVRAHQELHQSERIGWLRAAVLGANDGVVSAASVVDRWDEPRVFVPAKSPVIARLVKHGVLPTSEATPPRRLPLENVAALAVREAEAPGNTDLIAHWFLLLPSRFAWEIQDDAALEAIKTNPHIQELRSIAERSGADRMDFGCGATRRPALEDLNELEEDDVLTKLLCWWFSLE
jgi:hypothetical protein